jgi:lipid-binding SYLF domain-containing protein
LRAEILSYSRSRGLFAGIALKGSTLRSDDSDNKKIYGKDTKHEDILHARVPAPSVAQSLIATLNKYSSVEKAD